MVLIMYGFIKPSRVSLKQKVFMDYTARRQKLSFLRGEGPMNRDSKQFASKYVHNSMKSTWRSMLISLCLHTIVLIAAAFMLRQPLNEEFTDNLIVEIFSVKRQRQPRRKKQIEPPADLILMKLQGIPFRFRPDSPGERIPIHTQNVDVNLIRRPLNTAQNSPQTPADLSTAARELRADTTVLSQTEATTSTGAQNAGLNSFGTTGIGQLHSHTSIRNTVAIRVDGAAEVKLSDRIDVLLREKSEFEWVMPELAIQIVRSAKGRLIDVLFVVDVSGSMRDNIAVVTRHLSDMIYVYQAARVDYALGFTAFYSKNTGNQLKTFPLTKQMDECQREIRSLRAVTDPHNGQNPLDAINKSVKEMVFRSNSQKNLILVTDDSLTSAEGITLDDIITLCREFDIHVHVLGLNTNEQQRLAAETGGSWYPVPEEKARSVQ